MISLQAYNPPQNKVLGAIIFSLLWVGMGLMFADMMLFDVVVMPLYIALLLWIVPGAILTPYLNNANPSKKLKGLAKIIIMFVISIIEFGSITLFAVLALDYYPANGTPLTVQNFPVVKYGYTQSRSGDKTLCADISYQNHYKRFDFPEYKLTDSSLYHYVQLQTTPGYIGFDVIRSKKLVK
jgi:hypothetical protein